MKQLIYRSGCWGCKRSYEDPSEKYLCPQLPQHRAEHKKQEAIFYLKD